MSTIYDVANAAGVSISTVSHVLNQTRYVRDETKARVLEAVEQLNYQPNSVARALVRQETRTLALIVPDNVNPFFAELARGIENFGFEAGYNVLLCNSDRNTAKEIAYLDMLLSKRVDGVIFMPSERSEESLQRLREQKIRGVLFDRIFSDLDAVLLDNRYGGQVATEHLLSLGHTRIACIGGPDGESRSSERVVGYQSALTASGHAVDPQLIRVGDWTYQSGLEIAEVLLALPSPPTAIFACNDNMAIGVLAAVHARSLGVPGDISVVGFDNITLSKFSNPPLTTVATPIVDVGEQLCQLLLHRINDDLPATPQHIQVRGELLVRASTAPVPALYANPSDGSQGKQIGDYP